MACSPGGDPVLLGLPDTDIVDQCDTSWIDNKIGGYPDWMLNSILPLCGLCKRNTAFVCQLYCPLDGSIYHRTLYIFACVNKACWNKSKSWKVLRSQTLDSTSQKTPSADQKDLDIKDSQSTMFTETDDWGVTSDVLDTSDNWRERTNESQSDLISMITGNIDRSKNSRRYEQFEVTLKASKYDGNDVSKMSSIKNCQCDQGNDSSTKHEKCENLNVAVERDGSSKIFTGVLNISKEQIKSQMEDISISELNTMHVLVDSIANLKDSNVSYLDPENVTHNLNEQASVSRFCANNNSRKDTALQGNTDTIMSGNSEVIKDYLCTENDKEKKQIADDKIPVFTSHYVNVFDEPTSQSAGGMTKHEKHLLHEYARSENVDLSTFSDIGTLNFSSGGSEGYEKVALKHGDKIFHKFKKRVSACPQQILRYQYNGNPLHITATDAESKVPPCEKCNKNRVFELQLMPGLLLLLQTPGSDECRLEFGTVLVYTCSESCWHENDDLKTEYVIVQSDPDSLLFKT